MSDAKYEDLTINKGEIILNFDKDRHCLVKIEEGMTAEFIGKAFILMGNGLVRLSKEKNWNVWDLR